MLNKTWGPVIAGACLLIASAGYCAKTELDTSATKTNDSGIADKYSWGDAASIAVMTAKFTAEEKTLRERQVERAKAFAAAKEKQAEKLSSGAGEDISAEARRFFAAAKRGDDAKVHTMFSGFMKRYRHYYADSSGDKALDTSYWSTMLEVDLVYECVIPTDPKSVQFFVDDTINSIPAGSIYFGGTDPGRGLITGFTKSHVDADPFFTITQNALADEKYLGYLRKMYGDKIYIPTDEVSSNCFSEYYKDAEARAKHDQDHPGEPRQIKPGEDIRYTDGKLQISGQVAVMAINALLVKSIFDHNPKQEYYVEESFPLDWMYPYLEPHGPIMKINRAKQSELSAAIVAKDREYWDRKTKEKLGGWLTPETSVASLAKFAERVFGNKDLTGFSGDERYLQSVLAQKMTSKLRSSIGGLYEWRSQHAKLSVERERMQKEADYAFRQAFALCPYSPEAVFRYVQLLVQTGRIDDAILLTSAALKAGPDYPPMMSLLEQLKQMKKQ